MIKSLPSFKTNRRGTSQEQGLRYNKGRRVIGSGMNEVGDGFHSEAEAKPRRHTSQARQM